MAGAKTGIWPYTWSGKRRICALWRYAPLLPVPADIANQRNLAPGMTRLHRADNLAKALGITGTLWIKDDSGNPTHSFKDGKYYRDEKYFGDVIYSDEKMIQVECKNGNKYMQGRIITMQLVGS